MAYVRLDFDDETELWIETVGPSEPNHEAATQPGGAVVPTSKRTDRNFRMDRVVDVAKAVTSRFVSELKAFGDPDELALEFGISLDVGSKLFLSSRGTIKVQAKWKRRT